MGNETEYTRFLAHTTIKPETKTGLDKTESIMVRRPIMEPQKVKRENHQDRIR